MQSPSFMRHSCFVEITCNVFLLLKPRYETGARIADGISQLVRWPGISCHRQLMAYIVMHLVFTVGTTCIHTHPHDIVHDSEQYQSLIQCNDLALCRYQDAQVHQDSCLAGVRIEGCKQFLLCKLAAHPSQTDQAWINQNFRILEIKIDSRLREQRP